MTDLIDGADQKPLVRIENAETLFISPRGLILTGNVLDHPGFGEGAFIYSSTILRQDLAAGIFETRNTIYQVV